MTFNKRVAKDDEREDQGESSDFEKMLAESFSKPDKKLSPGDKIKGEVLSVGKEHVIVATGTRFDGYVPSQLLQDEQGQSKVKSGDFIELYVTHIKGAEVYLSPQSGSSAVSDDIQEAFSQNMRVQGKVESVNKGGFQVMILGKAAFCPLSQMDVKRIEKPEEYLGKKFEFKITQFENGGRNIVVSRRKVLDEGQGAAQDSFKGQRSPGDKVTGKVTRVEPFGAFVEISPGLEGMVHVSELSWARVSNPGDVVKVGDVVTAKILRIEQEERRLKISLTLKDAANDPWQNLPSQIQTGRVVGGKVTRLMDFGAFVQLHPGIEGLVPLSAMSSTKRVNRADEVVQVGQEIAVMVKEINPSSKRISLSIKDALDQAVNMSETQDIQEYAAKQAAREAAPSMGSLGEKIQAAMKKNS